MDQVLAQLTQKTAILDQFGNKIPPLADFCKQKGINTGLPLGGALFIVGLITLLIEGWYILTMFLTVLYPGLHSIRAIESAKKEDDKVWLTYWMIFGLFNVVETFFGFIFYFVPYFDWIRLGFFIWLLAPQFNGAKVLYESVLKTLLNENQDLIRDLIEKTRSFGSQAINTAAAEATDPQNMMKAMSMAAEAKNKIDEATAEPTSEAKLD
jgi:receptor expression-enhancing protein 5/6